MKDTKALIVVDVQNDFCPGGALPVSGGNEVVAVLNRYMNLFTKKRLPVFATRDWHPEKTSHFKEFGGQWPTHCVQSTKGAEFHPDLKLLEGTIIVTKGDLANEDSYSGFHGRDPMGRPLQEALEEEGVGHIYVGGLATDYCVRATVLEGLKRGFRVTILSDAIRGVDLNPGDSDKALREMRDKGADTLTVDDIKL